MQHTQQLTRYLKEDLMNMDDGTLSLLEERVTDYLELIITIRKYNKLK